MIAYDEQQLYNAYVRSQADKALGQSCISEDTHRGIYDACKVDRYTPNYFVRIGLALLTLLIVVSTGWLLDLMVSGSIDSYVPGFISIACFGCAEWLIHKKKHYNSGVDNMLVWASAYAMWMFCEWYFFPGSKGATAAFVAFIIFDIAAVRFADTILSVAAIIALLCFFVFITWFPKTGYWAHHINSISLAIVSAVVYFVSARPNRSGSLLFYNSCAEWVSITALVAFYGCGIFPCYVLDHYYATPGIFAWLWLFLVPLIYIAAGVSRKDVVLIRTGIPLIAFSVIWFRRYHHIIEPEVAMLIGGAVLFIVSWFLIKYLREPRHGFTFDPEVYTSDEPRMGNVLRDAVVERATGR